MKEENDKKDKEMVCDFFVLLLFYVIGNCDAISYYIKNAPRGCADRGDGVNCCAIPRSR